MLAGLLAPSSGEATVAGIRLSRETIDQVRARIGFLTEAPGLWDRLTVRQNLMVYARLHQVRDPVGTVTPRWIGSACRTAATAWGPSCRRV